MMILDFSHISKKIDLFLLSIFILQAIKQHDDTNEFQSTDEGTDEERVQEERTE